MKRPLAESLSSCWTRTADRAELSWNCWHESDDGDGEVRLGMGLLNSYRLVPPHSARGKDGAEDWRR